MNELMQFISAVGFPIVACVGMGWFVKYQTDQNTAEVATMRKEHLEEITKVTEALNNNTLAIQRLTDMIQKGE